VKLGTIRINMSGSRLSELGPVAWRPVMMSPPTKLGLCSANCVVALIIWPMTPSLKWQ
jgi:hypothetical protein